MALVGASGFKKFVISVSKPTLSKLSFSQFYGRAIKCMNTTLCADEIKGLVYIGLWFTNNHTFEQTKNNRK